LVAKPQKKERHSLKNNIEAAIEVGYERAKMMEIFQGKVNGGFLNKIISGYQIIY
jgi:hypothetical protein